MDSLHIAATGMQSQQLALETIANNLANLQTPGFKRSKVSFTELMYRQDATAASSAAAGSAQQGLGVGAASFAKVFEQGEVRQTGGALDLAIRGDGMLEVTLPDGSTAYTRGGALKLSKDGQITTQTGLPLKAMPSLPQDATQITITAQGQVMVGTPRQTGLVLAGQIELARFTNPDSLTAMGDGVYKSTDLTGEPIYGRPGEQGLGLLAQGYMESSNVKLMDEMVALMIAQRSYEANSKVIQASDDMLGMVNSLRR